MVHFVGSCDVCQRQKANNTTSSKLLQPPIPTKVWSDISMDFIDGLSMSYGKWVILVVVDRSSKFIHFLALSHPYTALSVAQIFMDQVFKIHRIAPNHCQ
ncbi:hypothetical protein ACH5RR_008592 [Cinchona calisaya]|uniref:Integrase n=1 Tax=Cinchona calisaya TaxID=153742 RepID=A0ABD3AFE8_9GENT